MLLVEFLVRMPSVLSAAAFLIIGYSISLPEYLLSLKTGLPSDVVIPLFSGAVPGL